MHVLTKIFIVLVSLLSVAIVPLMAVNARNEASFKTQLEDARTKAAAAQAALSANEASRLAAEATSKAELQALNDKMTALNKEAAGRLAEISRLQAELAAAKALQASINANLELLSQTGKANSDLTKTLVAEVTDWRSRALAAERRQTELEESLATKIADAEVLLAQVRMLQETNQSLLESKTVAEDTVDRYVAFAGDLPGKDGSDGSEPAMRVPADRDLACSVIGVTMSGETKLAEINAGSRDGIRAGWVLSIADNGRFLANLRITDVDVNRASGIIELENSGRGLVAAGQKALARKGE